MPLFQAVRRRRKWPLVLPLYDGRTCPDCGSVVCGPDARIAHRAWHEDTWHWQDQVRQAIRQVAERAGLSVGERLDAGELHGLDRVDDEDYDDRLTRKARRAMAQDPAEDDDEIE